MLHDPDRLELKYEYIYYHMGLEAEDFGLCKMWVDLPLEEIMARHEFLVKAGKYVFPDEKKPQLAKVIFSNILLRTFFDLINTVFYFSH